MLDAERIDGVWFPRGLERRKLIVTGPPGTGKSTIMRHLGGWPEEGYLDLTQPQWWKSRQLALRPREIHFGLPFQGFTKAVPVYACHALDEAAFLELDLFRIRLPPPRWNPLIPDFRNRYVFEFVIPPPQWTFAKRQERARHGTHEVDRDLTLAQVTEEAALYRQLAQFFYQSGLQVYLREDPEGYPSRFATLPSSFPMAPPQPLYEQLDQIRLRQRILARAWSARGNRELLGLFVEMLPPLLGVERCAVYVLDRAGREVWLQTCTGCRVGQPLDWEETVVWKVVKEGDYLVREDGGKESRLRNELAVPIRSLSGGHAIGAILIGDTLGGRPFREEDRVMLERIALHLQTAVETLYLHQEMSDLSTLMSTEVRNVSWNFVVYGLLAGMLLGALGIRMWGG